MSRGGQLQHSNGIMDASTLSGHSFACYDVNCMLRLVMMVPSFVNRDIGERPFLEVLPAERFPSLKLEACPLDKEHKCTFTVSNNRQRDRIAV